MKSKLITLVSLSFSVLLAGACAPEAPQDEPTSGLSLLSNGPDLPEECDPCWDAFQDCFANGNATEECAQQIIECVDVCQAPPPPDECLHCAAGFEACAVADQDNGGTGEDCAVGFEGCLAACEGESQCDADPANCDTEPPINECEACDLDFDQCINNGWGDPGDENQDPAGETEQCEQEWDACHQNCDDGWNPGGEDELCQLAEEQCENNADDSFQTTDGEVLSCQDVLVNCFGQDPTDPQEPSDCDFCDDAQSQCADGGDNNLDCQDIENFCSQVCP